MKPSSAPLALILTTCFASVCLAQGTTEASRETSRAEVEQCIAQHDSARQLRLSEEWQAARSAMVSCAEEHCPLAIAADCRAWLDEVERLMPTLIVVVEGEDLGALHSALRVELDGVSVALEDPPVPIELLPGAHQLRFQLPGEEPAVVNFSLAKGEKNHIERVRFTPRQAVRPPAPAPIRVPARPVPAATYWLSAGALAAFATSGAFLVAGLNERADAREICAPTCAHDIRTSIQGRLLVADIAGGAGLVLGGLAVYSYLRRPVVLTGARASGPTISASREGLSLLWRGQF